MFSRFSEVTEFLYSQLPFFQNQGKIAIKPGLKNIQALCEIQGNPQNSFKTIHVAGTNGKGSSSHMIASILQEAGYKVGLYTSPHLKNFTERIKINGREVPKKWVINYVNKHIDILDKIKPSFFEWSVIMAFDYFKEKKVDYAIIEVGLGGRLDSTNIIHPEICLITNIGFDHTDILGNTLPQIAYEKAGIIKNQIPVCISEYHEKTLPVFKNKAAEENAPILFAQDQLLISNSVLKKDYQKIDLIELSTGKKISIQTDLLGQYQGNNVRGVFQLIKQFSQEKGIQISEEIILNGFKKVLINTNFKGRWQKLGENPWIYADTAHNSEGLKWVVNQINEWKAKGKYVIFGLAKDKLKPEIIKILKNLHAEIILVGGKNPRLVELNELASYFERGFERKFKKEKNPNLALKKLKEMTHPEDLIVVTGSNFIVAEINL